VVPLRKRDILDYIKVADPTVLLKNPAYLPAHRCLTAGSGARPVFPPEKHGACVRRCEALGNVAHGYILVATFEHDHCHTARRNRKRNVTHRRAPASRRVDGHIPELQDESGPIHAL
jgi:hypothetical protein